MNYKLSRIIRKIRGEWDDKFELESETCETFLFLKKKIENSRPRARARDQISWKFGKHFYWLSPLRRTHAIMLMLYVTESEKRSSGEESADRIFDISLEDLFSLLRSQLCLDF